MNIRPPTRVTINLDQDIGAALVAMCEQDLRYPKQQIAWVLRREAERRGLVKNEAAGSFGEVPPAASQATS